MQEVNLLSDDLRPQHDPFTLREFGIAWAVLVVLLALVTGWQAYSNALVASELNATQAALSSLGKELQTLEQAANKPADAVLLQELDALVDQRDEQKHLLDVLQKEPHVFFV